MRGGLVRLGGIDQRGHHHHAVDADTCGLLGGFDGEGRGELGDAAQHGDAAGRDRLGRLHDGDLFLALQRGVLADGPADDQSGNAVADQAVHDFCGRIDIE